MAKKSDVAADGSPPVKPKSQKSTALSRTPLRASSLLDIRVIYCADNLELPERRQKCERGRTKSARLQIPPSAFQLQPFRLAGSIYYHCDWHASHCVKVMLDQIFGENN